MNPLEQLVSEWLQYNGYFVRLSVPVGKRERGSYSGELDVVAYNLRSKHLLHVECSLDSDSWPREKRFSEKLKRGKQYVHEVFPGLSLPEKLDQKIVLQYTSVGHKNLANGEIISVGELIHEIFDGLKNTSPASGAGPSTLPLLRTLQLATDALQGGVPGARLIDLRASE